MVRAGKVWPSSYFAGKSQRLPRDQRRGRSSLNKREKAAKDPPSPNLLPQGILGIKVLRFSDFKGTVSGDSRSNLLLYRLQDKSHKTLPSNVSVSSLIDPQHCSNLDFKTLNITDPPAGFQSIVKV
jgi:hypothetical protein